MDIYYRAMIDDYHYKLDDINSVQYYTETKNKLLCSRETISLQNMKSVEEKNGQPGHSENIIQNDSDPEELKSSTMAFPANIEVL